MRMVVGGRAYMFAKLAGFHDPGKTPPRRATVIDIKQGRFI